jgi:hypothetical protein
MRGDNDTHCNQILTEHGKGSRSGLPRLPRPAAAQKLALAGPGYWAGGHILFPGKRAVRQPLRPATRPSFWWPLAPGPAVFASRLPGVCASFPEQEEK